MENLKKIHWGVWVALIVIAASAAYYFTKGKAKPTTTDTKKDDAAKKLAADKAKADAAKANAPAAAPSEKRTLVGDVQMEEGLYGELYLSQNQNAQA